MRNIGMVRTAVTLIRKNFSAIGCRAAFLALVVSKEGDGDRKPACQLLADAIIRTMLCTCSTVARVATTRLTRASAGVSGVAYASRKCKY